MSREREALTIKESWWAGARAGAGMPPDAPRCEVAKVLAEKKPPGRPPLPPEQAQTAMIRERVTEAQKAEYAQRGGKAWLVRELSRKPRK